MGNMKRLYEAPKLFKTNCEIDWRLPSKRIYDFIRGLSPYPVRGQRCWDLTVKLST